MGFDLLNGLKAQLESVQPFPFEFLFENIGHGGDSSEVYNKAEKLLMQGADAIIAYLDHTEAEKLDQLFIQLKRILIVLDPGGHVPLQWNNCNPYRYTISLQSAYNNYLTGILAAQNGTKRAFFATSFYEGGYLQTYSYQRGYREQGGEILYHSVVPFHIHTYTIDNFSYNFERLHPETILAQFSAEAGKYFLDQYIKTSFSRDIPMYVSALMLEESWLDTLPFPFAGIRGYVSWHRSIESESNRQFIDTIRKRYDTIPNLFTLLGWESGILLHKLLKQSCLLNISDNISLHSPRGVLSLHKDSNTFFGPAYLTEIIEDKATGHCRLEQITQLNCQAKTDDFTGEVLSGVFSKWTNTYLCI